MRYDLECRSHVFISPLEGTMGFASKPGFSHACCRLPICPAMSPASAKSNIRTLGHPGNTLVFGKKLYSKMASNVEFLPKY